MHLKELPPQQVGDHAWYGSQMASAKNKWTHYLTDEECLEIKMVAKEPAQCEQPTRPRLLKLAHTMENIRHKLVSGQGFYVLRNFPLDDLTAREQSAALLAVSTLIGVPRSQNGAGHLVGHIRDFGLTSDNPSVRIYQTKERLSMHTDGCDVVALAMLQPAMRGGESTLVSATTIYNEFRTARPDLVPLLFEPVATDRRGEIPAGELPYTRIPILSWHDGHIIPSYQRQYIESAQQRFPEAPRLTEEHVAALDLFDDLANNQDLALSMKLERGDVQFVYNHSLLHDRTAFHDWPDIERRRHLLRVWLSVPGDRPLPEVFATRLGTIEVGKRGGINVPGVKLCIPSLAEACEHAQRLRRKPK